MLPSRQPQGGHLDVQRVEKHLYGLMNLISMKDTNVYNSSLRCMAIYH